MKESFLFTFDFDRTIHANDTYMEFLFEETLGKEMLKIIKNDPDHFSHNIQALHPVLVTKYFSKKYKFAPNKDSVKNTISIMKKFETQGMKEIFTYLKNLGHEIFVIGGGVYGCAIIPEFVKDMGIPKKNIYSGYFNGYDPEEIYIATFDDFRFTNAENPKFETPYSPNKSELIKKLKSLNIIPQGKKIIHIGDGLNDLEVSKNNQCDIFIGFGINFNDLGVEKESKIYVKTMDEFNAIIQSIAF